MADKTKLMPQQEQEFQRSMAGFDPQIRAWSSKFKDVVGGPPNVENDPSFDYRKAFRAGDRPQAIEGDTIPHWPSTGKGEDHPTAWKQKFFEQFNADIDKLDPAKQTPEMREWLRENLPLPNMNELLRAITEDPRLLEVLDALQRQGGSEKPTK
jgi:hypothetical protein